ncbi:MAG: hypothetical protein PHN88_15040 [Ignavibacteria bacterium]|nr:hypothetical protein [Ignavibacteria bacterium]
MKTSKIKVCFLLATLLFCAVFSNMQAQIFEDSRVSKFFKDKTVLGLNFVDSDLWVSTQIGVYKYNVSTDRVKHFYFAPEKSNPIRFYLRENQKSIDIYNILSDGKTILFCDYLNNNLVRLENDSIKYLNLRSYANINGLISSLNIYNNDIWFVVGEDLYYGNPSSNIYYLRNNQLYEYENPFGKTYLEYLFFYIMDSLKYFIGVEFDKDRKIYSTSLIVKSGETTILNSEIDTNRQRVEYKTFRDSNRIFLLDNMGKLIKIENDVVEKMPLDFNYYSKRLMGNREYYWFTANKDFIYITNVNGLFIYDFRNKILIKKIEYPKSIVLENIIFKDNKIWGSLGPVSTDIYNAYSIGIIDLSKY